MNASPDESVTHRLNTLLSRQKAAFVRDGAPSLEERRFDLTKFRNAMINNRREIEEAINTDFGHRSRHETAFMEVAGVSEGAKYLVRNLRKFMAPTGRKVALYMRPGRAWIEYQPLGVVGVMSPWNYPVNLSLMPVVTAIAAGNRVMLKPSEFTPVTNNLLAEILGNLFPEEQLAVVTGDTAMAAAFAGLPFDHLMFTGSAQVGRSVLKAASQNLVPVTLELGGKSPCIVAKSYDLKRTAASIAFGKLLSAGQTCVAPDYALVHEDDVASFVKEYDRTVASFYPTGAASLDYTSIVNERHYARLQGLIEDARSKGAKIIPVGMRSGDLSVRPNTMAPSIVLGVTDDMRLAHEEIFGPILPVLPYRELEGAIDYVNARPRPLALYYFGGNDDDKREVLSQTISGNVTVNGTIMHLAQENLPFGGVGDSGMGAYHGIEGFRTFSHAKGIYEQGRWSLSSLFRPPFGRTAEGILSMVLR
jgi:coniferyl-aldehyde dehydrogenase